METLSSSFSFNSNSRIALENGIIVQEYGVWKSNSDKFKCCIIESDDTHLLSEIARINRSVYKTNNRVYFNYKMFTDAHILFETDSYVKMDDELAKAMKEAINIIKEKEGLIYDGRRIMMPKLNINTRKILIQDFHLFWYEDGVDETALENGEGTYAYQTPVLALYFDCLKKQFYVKIESYVLEEEFDDGDRITFYEAYDIDLQRVKRLNDILKDIHVDTKCVFPTINMYVRFEAYAGYDFVKNILFELYETEDDKTLETIHYFRCRNNDAYIPQLMNHGYLVVKGCSSMKDIILYFSKNCGNYTFDELITKYKARRVNAMKVIYD